MTKNTEDFNFEKETGWVAIPRSIQYEKFYQDSQYVHLFLHLILSMNRKEDYYNFIKIEKFQLLTSRSSLSKKLKISESKIQRMLKKLEKFGYIEQQTTTKHRIITILHEDCRNIFEQQANNKRTTSEQQVNNKRTTSEHKQQNNRITDKQNNIFFEKFFENYPLKKSKQKAKQKFMILLRDSKNPDKLFEKIMTGLELYKKEIEIKKTGPEYIKHPSTWLNNICWQDEYIESDQDKEDRELANCLAKIEKDLNSLPEDHRKIKQRFKEYFGINIYITWFSKLKIESITETEIVISVSDNFIKDHITQKFLNGRKKIINGKQVWLRKGIKEILKEIYPDLQVIKITTR